MTKSVESKIAFLLQEIRKIIKIVATICQIFRLKCTKIQFRLRLHPRPSWWASLGYKAAPDLLARFKGSTSKRREGEGRGFKTPK